MFLGIRPYLLPNRYDSYLLRRAGFGTLWLVKSAKRCKMSSFCCSEDKNAFAKTCNKRSKKCWVSSEFGLGKHLKAKREK